MRSRFLSQTTAVHQGSNGASAVGPRPDGDAPRRRRALRRRQALIWIELLRPDRPRSGPGGLIRDWLNRAAFALWRCRRENRRALVEARRLYAKLRRTAKCAAGQS